MFNWKRWKASLVKRSACGLSLALLCGVLTGCASSSETQDQKSESSVVASEATQSEKELEILRVGVADMPDNMDPMLGIGNSTIRLHYNIFETLIQADQKDNYKQKDMLAESWERIDDYTVEFKLKEGVKFHNGDELKASDVVFSLNRLKEDIPNIELAASLMSTIDHVEAVDDYTVRVVTSEVDPILEDRLASSWGGWILPEAYLKEVGNDGFALNPVGTGPFKVISFSPDKVVLERFEDYWGEKPNVKRIEYICYPETSARITALMTGEVDLITQVPPDQIETVESDPNLQVVSTVISNMHVLQYNTTSGPLESKELRQALNLAIDRQLLVDTLWSGKAVVPNGHQYPEYDDLYFADYPATEYNPEKAKELVKESGYNGEEIIYELKPNYYTFGNEAAEAIVDMWKQIGVNAKIVYTDEKSYDGVANWSNSMRFPDPCGGLWLLWGPGSSPAEKTWLDMPQEFIDAGNTLSSVIDEEERKEAAKTLMEIWDEEAPGTLLYYPFESWGIRKGLEWTPYSSQAIDFRKDNFKVVE